ncbi:MAG: hypothetical protein HXX20_20225 [Chloroflexi bacterium]|nr:hypothetical protein [Chloroflexota bacterium]
MGKTWCLKADFWGVIVGKICSQILQELALIFKFSMAFPLLGIAVDEVRWVKSGKSSKISLLNQKPKIYVDYRLSFTELFHRFFG